MAFSKQFFDNLSELLGEYFEKYPCGFVTLTIKAYDQEYNVAAILKHDEELLTFTYYFSEKRHALPEKFKERTGQSDAWPALTIPYDAILFVEFNPGKTGDGEQIGFKSEN